MAATAVLTAAFTVLGGKLIVDLDCDGGAPTDNVTGATSGSIFMVEINNEANSAAVYLKIRDASSATVGTTTANGAGTPHLMFYAPAYTKISYLNIDGHAFTAGVSMWCTTAAAVGTTTNPSNDVIVKLVSS